MNELIALLLEYLPKQIAWIELLRFIPDAAETVKELTAYVNRVIAYLKQDAPLTPEQEAVRDAIIDGLAEKPWWKPDAPGPR